VTIERGGVWGEPLADLPELGDYGSASTDSAVAELAAAGHPAIGLGALDGDLARTLGIDRVRPEPERYGYPFDLGIVQLDDGPELPFVAGVVAHRHLWRGEFAIVANCGWFGNWYVGPKAHPNDGLLDVTVGSLSPAQRLLAHRRLPTGSHVPHPDLTTLRCGAWEHRFDSPVRVSIDHRSIGRARSLRVSVQPDRFMLVV